MPKRNKFSLSNYKLLSCDMGELVPVNLEEVLPGDSIQQSTSALIRVSPLLAPVMHPVSVRLHHWFVPHRLIWEDWEDFITGGADGFDASVFPTITLDAGNSAIGTLGDYLGLPTDAVGSLVSALPFRAIALIFNEWYRDQDLVTELVIDKTSGADTTTETDLQNIAWEKDYFTSSRPWTQKGPEVTLPVTGDAPISGIGFNPASSMATGGTFNDPAEGDDASYPFYQFSSAASVTAVRGLAAGPDTTPDVFADMSNVTAASINDLRLAFALQRYEEARARYGSRYTEYLRYLGVKSSDARLQRPEYLGGGTSTIQFSEVLATAETGTEVDVGDLKGHGIAAARSNKYRRFFEEHGYCLTLMSVRPKTMYVQGLSRTWNRRTKEDFWQKELEHIGQQEVLNQEILASHATPAGIFGYQDRYDEYRRRESTIGGEFRSTLLDFWHMARIFASDPALNSDFVTSTPTKRINAVQTNDVLWCMVKNSVQARRYLSKTGSSYIF